MGHVLFNFQEDNKWELKVDRVPGQKMTTEATVNGKKWTGVGNLNQGEMKLNLKMDSEFTGKHYTLDFDLNPSGMWGIHITGDVDGPVDAKWTMQKDYTMGEIVVKYKNQNYAFMQLKGNAEMRGVFPVVFDYVVKYNIKDAMEHQGKAKMKFDGKTPAKKFEMSFAPKTGTPMDLIWNMDFSSGFKYDYDFKMNAVTMEKGNGEYKWVNNGQKFELMTKDTFIVTKQSPFHWMNTLVTGGREWTKMEHTRNIFFDKVNKAQMINKMKIEEHNILDGQTWYHIKYDNTAPKTAFLFTYLPYNMDQAWTYEGGREHTANGGFTLTHKITHGENVIQEAEWVFDVKANDGSKFEMEHLHKMTMTEESPFYGMVYWYTGRYGKNVERKMTVFFDKINKSILFVPKMKMDTTLTIDGEKISEFVFDNTQAKKHIKFFYSPDAYTKDYLFTDEWEYPGHSGCKWNTELKRGDVSIWNWVGDYSFVNNANKFEMKTMDKIVQTEMSPFYGLYRGYGGYGYYRGKRSADADAVATADADAEPGFYGGYYGGHLGGYHGYGGYGGYVHYLGKRSADAEAEPGFYRGYGGYGGYRGYGGYGYYRGKRSADAEAEPGFYGGHRGGYYGGYRGFGYGGFGYRG